MNYLPGQQYEMKVVDIRKDSAGYNYIALHDEDPSKEYRVYNILKCQYDSLPDTIYVQVKNIDEFGRIKFRQDEGRLFQEHYKVGKLYLFEVTEIGEDWQTKASYYTIEDDFSSHRYYFQGNQKYQIGDSCILEVDGFTDKGFLKLKEVNHTYDTSIAKPIDDTADNTAENSFDLRSDLPVLDITDEGEKLELKTSIVFPPDKKGEADIDKQMYNILKELTAFMNTEGGELYIGIHDKTKKVVGIENDFCHLNEGEDEFAGSYSENADGYQLKIRNTIDKLCPSLANSLISIECPSLDGHIYCKISVKAARRPIFLSGTQLYIRQGNRVKLLRSDEITFFITERMTISIKEILDTDDTELMPAAMDMDALKQIIKEILNERHHSPDILPKPLDLDTVDYWITWYNDSSWKRSRKKPDEADVYIQVPVYKNMSDPVLAFCYDTNKVSTIKLSEFRKGSNLNKLQRNGWSRTGDKPKNIFLMLPTDFLVGYSVDHNGINYVKLHAISDYTPSKSPTNTGAPFIPDGGCILSYGVLGAEHRKYVRQLIVPKANRTTTPGTPINSVSMRDQVDYVEEALVR